MNEKVFEKSDWIWCDKKFGENEYAEFYDTVTYSGERAVLKISVCGDYTVFINGRYVASNQYADFPHYKVYDEMDITDFLVTGKNTVCFLVWYFGEYGMRYYTPIPSLIYEIKLDGDITAYSTVKTLSRKSKAYKSGSKKTISPQLAYSFEYDATAEDEWLNGDFKDFTPSVVMQKKAEFYKRPVKKLTIGDEIIGEIIPENDGYIIDFGQEFVGLLTLYFISSKPQKINISYGENLENGHVKRLVGGRDFSFDFTAKSGENKYTNYMFRFACRYVEIKCDNLTEIKQVGILPQYFSVEEIKKNFDCELDKQIYDICLNTLKLCMMEHYVDCPWREQCLYAFDSRNQMLSGYYAFKNGNFDYARSNLLLMSKDNREDNLLSICFPSASDLTIPSFSLYYIVAVNEYLTYSGDLPLGREVFYKLEKILSKFLSNRKDGLVCRFSEKSHWHFYDWSPNAYLEIGEQSEKPDFLLNCIVVIALKAYANICKLLSENNVFENEDLKILKATREKFYNRKNGMFFVEESCEEPTELANSLAVLSGVAEGSVAQKICEKLANNILIPCSLSMKTFKYDAMLKTDKNKYKDSVFNEIRQTYKIMLDSGSKTVWETIDGAAAFDNAGSLCHGWSAIPIYYYGLFDEVL